MAVKQPILQKGRLVCSIDVINIGLSESNLLPEAGNKVFKHNTDVPNPKILVTKLDFVF